MKRFSQLLILTPLLPLLLLLLIVPPTGSDDACSWWACVGVQPPAWGGGTVSPHTPSGTKQLWNQQVIEGTSCNHVALQLSVSVDSALVFGLPTRREQSYKYTATTTVNHTCTENQSSSIQGGGGVYPLPPPSWRGEVMVVQVSTMHGLIVPHNSAWIHVLHACE
jgi:hypothetical protein